MIRPFPIMVTLMLSGIAYLIIHYQLYWFVSAVTRSGGAQ
jgi:hypothetical protein